MTTENQDVNSETLPVGSQENIETKEQEQAEVSDIPPFEPKQKKVNFVEDIESFLEATEEAKADMSASLRLFRESLRNVTGILDHYSDEINRITKIETEYLEGMKKRGQDIPGDNEGNPWLRTLFSALRDSVNSLEGQDALERPDALWRHGIESNGKLLMAGRPKQRLGTGKYTNQELISYVTRKAGVGSTWDIPLWHSGIWIRVRSPSLQEVASYHQELAQVRVELGEATKGLAFSNVAALTIGITSSFVMGLVIDASINYRTPTDLKEKILNLDLPFALIAVACTMYPDGYDYAAPCVAGPGECDHIVRERIKLNTLLWVDENSISKTQRNLMARRLNQKSTDAELEEYRNSRIIGNDKTVFFGDIGVVLSVPTLLQQEDSGTAWIDGMIEMTKGAFNEPPTGTNRQRFIRELASSTSARQYAHFVKEVIEPGIEEGDEAVVITSDIEAISGILANVFTDERYHNKFVEEINKFIDESLVSMVAIKSYNCPVCETPRATVFNQRFEHLAAIDPFAVFFILAGQKHMNHR